MTWLIVVGVIVVAFGSVVFFGAPYLPSQRRYVRRAFEDLYRLGSKDVLVDFGSGDGIVLRIASTYGSKAVGYEINPVLVLISKVLSLGQARVSTRLANFWTVTLPEDTTIVYIFSVGRDGKKVKSLTQREADRLGRPLKLMCYGSPLPGMTPDKILQAYALYTFHPS